MSIIGVLSGKLILCPRIEKMCAYAHNSADKHYVLCFLNSDIEVHLVNCRRNRDMSEDGYIKK